MLFRSNIGGGAAWPVGRIDSVLAAARRHGLSTHLDGARLMNASVASGVAPARYAEGFDSVTLCFSKGLGAPVGAALAGSREFIQEAWRFKHMLGGSMRQSGVLAAAALYALEHNVGRLAEDHANARLLAEALAELPGIRLDPGEVETNIVVFETAMDTAAEFAKRMAHEGVDFHAVGPAACRLVTHLDVSAAEIELAIARFQRVLG